MKEERMKDERKVLSKGAEALLWLVVITVELVITWCLLALGGIPAITKGYWFIVWIFFGVLGCC